MFLENCLPFEGALGADPVGEAFAFLSPSSRYAQMEDKYSF